MYDPIILTLDGTKLAERAIPHAVDLARRYGSKLVVLHVVTPETGPAGLDNGDRRSYVYQELEDARRHLAQRYVHDKVAEIRTGGLDVDGFTLLGDAASSIVDFTARRPKCLLVMVPHGRPGSGNRLTHSVADRVLREASIPVLLVSTEPPAETPVEPEDQRNVIKDR